MLCYSSYTGSTVERVLLFKLKLVFEIKNQFWLDRGSRERGSSLLFPSLDQQQYVLHSIVQKEIQEAH